MSDDDRLSRFPKRPGGIRRGDGGRLLVGVLMLALAAGAWVFWARFDDAVELAKSMVDIGEEAGKQVIALITNMEKPLGYAIGNSVEVMEAIDTLRGAGPRDLVDLIIELGSDMLSVSGVGTNRKEAKSSIAENLLNRGGFRQLEKLIVAQGGDPAVLENPDLSPISSQIFSRWV